MSAESVWRIDRLRELREKLGWSQRELGRRSGMGETKINKYEHGDNMPSALSVRQLAQTFGVSADYLLGLTDDPSGIVSDDKWNEDERTVLETFRREGWRGIAKLGLERIP